MKEDAAEKYPLLKKEKALVKMNMEATPPHDPYELSMRTMSGFLAPGVITSDEPVPIKNNETGVIWVIDPKQGKVVESYMPPEIEAYYKEKERRLAIASECYSRMSEIENGFRARIKGRIEDFLTFLKTGKEIVIDYQGNPISNVRGRIFRHGWRKTRISDNLEWTSYF